MNTLSKKIEQYKLIKSDIEALEDELKSLRIELECAALDAGGILRVESHTVKILEAQRESVSLKDAKNALGPKLDPFLKTSFYTILKVT